MKTQQAIEFAKSHGANIGRLRAGVYYVTFHDGNCIREIYVTGKSHKCATDWIAANLTRRAA